MASEVWAPRCSNCHSGHLILVPKEHQPIAGEPNNVGCTSCGRLYDPTTIVWVRL